MRLGHRLPRDERMTTHVALVSRAFGAERIIYAGQHDSSFEESIKKIVENWGGAFSVSYSKKPESELLKLKKSGYGIVHLTMYGMPLPEKLEEIAKHEKLVVIIGAEQVPRPFYELADFNISITNQPHSEVAALAITLDRLMQGKELMRKSFSGKISIEPSEKGKKTIKR
ncbi:tRNA (cytidine(56)-2'-O)-methyltransferase [Candidatus Micrarchaeota archaeon]|nr:tRNA (cytidine(56)-2'-O)-methyltransferase [Candidatus Micrarchaeota archaeon]